MYNKNNNNNQHIALHSTDITILTSTWPHLRCDVGLEEREILTELTALCYSIVYCYNGAQRYEQFLQVGRLYQALILLGLAFCHPSASLSSIFMMLSRAQCCGFCCTALHSNFFWFTSFSLPSVFLPFSLPFSELHLVNDDDDVGSQHLECVEINMVLQLYS